MKDELTPSGLSFPTSHKRHHSRTISQSLSSLSRQQSPALELMPAPTSSGTITLTTTTTVLAEVTRRPREYINVDEKAWRDSGFFLYDNFISECMECKRDQGLIEPISLSGTLDWNKLLIAARKSRGPYLCPSTRTYHVDRASNLYWSGYTEADAAEPEVSIPEKTENAEAQARSDTNNPNGSMSDFTSQEGGAPATAIATTTAVNGTISTPALSTPGSQDIKEESAATPNIGASQVGGTMSSSTTSLASGGSQKSTSQGDLMSPTLNNSSPAMNRAGAVGPNRGNPLMSPPQPGAPFTGQPTNHTLSPMAGQPGQEQQHAQPGPGSLVVVNPGMNPMMASAGSMPGGGGMMPGGFISPSSLMQPMQNMSTMQAMQTMQQQPPQQPGQQPQQQQPSPMTGIMNMGMNPAGFVGNPGQIHPQMMHQSPQHQQMYAQQQQQMMMQQQFLQQQQQAAAQQAQQQQQEFQSPPRPKGRPRQSKNSQVVLGSPTLNHIRAPSVSWADQQQPQQQQQQATQQQTQQSQHQPQS
ncbi:hypothetical protein BGZ83_010679 [Gryganskiella cystojenkinii]|nr:hypothetical protein BGZ83_010679 [Gryganskiella cystojenkinii]